LKKRALISVYDKTGVVEFAKQLTELAFEIISTSGTAKLLQENNIPIIRIEEITSQPEILGGRVKTLHPIIFGGILADRKNSDHVSQLEHSKIDFVDLVVVNLYPFEETVSRQSCSLEEAIEQIDIGGVSLIRAAAKNFNHVSVLVKPEQYGKYLEAQAKDLRLQDLQLRLAREAFQYITEYDLCISDYFQKLCNDKTLPNSLTLNYPQSRELRYGENPHQKAKLYLTRKNSFSDVFETLHGKELSYNNLLDIDAAFGIISEFEDTTCAIVKHTNPCGVASSVSLTEAYVKALATDSVSAFGGIVIVNQKLDLTTALEMDKLFIEIIIAPDFDDAALELLKKKKNRRLVRYRTASAEVSPYRHTQRSNGFRSIVGGMLAQETDETLIEEGTIKCVTNRQPNDSEYRDLLFSMKVAKHTKSNAVVYVKNLQTLGIGGGQPSRVDSSNLAVEKAKRFGLDLNGSAAASDAFFPFADGVIAAAKAGATSVIQPGGSVRDEEVIAAANEYGLAMLFTGIRHFRH
jgi:phosphoribosylaminoimidazolecarboxamide formyltransferase/IMP cyclohydrolase